APPAAAASPTPPPPPVIPPSIPPKRPVPVPAPAAAARTDQETQKPPEHLISTRPDTLVKPVAFVPSGPGVEGTSVGALPVRRPRPVEPAGSIADRVPRSQIPPGAAPQPWPQAPPVLTPEEAAVASEESSSPDWLNVKPYDVWHREE
ncbi:MAG: hypothetical protein LBO75_02120, partial [Bifidobacteriaceae bacterium]|nr:hypothetical protein [Bifidobacteriaceae bacterium]